MLLTYKIKGFVAKNSEQACKSMNIKKSKYPREIYQHYKIIPNN